MIRKSYKYSHKSDYEKDPTIYDIYALVDAVVGVFYVGMTTDLTQRYKQHLAGDANEEKTRLIRYLLAGDESIDLVRLDVAIGQEQARQFEAFWILYYTLAGSYLTNTSPGVLLNPHWLEKRHKDKLKDAVQQW